MPSGRPAFTPEIPATAEILRALLLAMLRRQRERVRHFARQCAEGA